MRPRPRLRALDALDALDTRASLCAEAGVPDARCDDFPSGSPESEAFARAELAAAGPESLEPGADPEATASEALRRAFADVLRSLEGAVFEATLSPEGLRDVLRREGRKRRFDPELMSLVTEAMAEPPETPGGEPVKLEDLVALDPQVTYDHVARRVTRLKLFRVLELPPETTEVAVEARGGSLLARLEREVLRPFSSPPLPSAGLALDLVWPGATRVGATAPLAIRLRSAGPGGGKGAEEAEARVPLPPGVRLARAHPGVRQVHGVLWVRRRLEPGVGAVLEVPLRFELAGAMTVPEASARLVGGAEEASSATAPAQRIEVSSAPSRSGPR